MSDKIVIPCAECGSNLAVPATAAGKRVRCPKCKTEVAIPAGSTPVHREPSQSAAVPKPEPRRARSVGEPPRPAAARRRPTEPAAPADDAWLDDGASLNSEWDSHGTPEQTQQALPPRARRKTGAGQASTLRGTGNEPPSPYESPREAVEKTPNRTITYGILMMAGAVVWFVAGLAGDVIFFYPPVMFVLGFIALVKGLMKTE